MATLHSTRRSTVWSGLRGLALGSCMMGAGLVAGCAGPAGQTHTARASTGALASTGYEAPSTGSLIAGGDEAERINKNGDPSFFQPQHGYGAAGTGTYAGGR